MPTNNKKIFTAGLLVLLAAAAITFIVTAKSFIPSFKKPSIAPEEEITPAAIPSLTPERREIVSKLETHVVSIQNKTFNPANLTIKLHDQVEWQNKDNETYQIKGEGWGDVPIRPGRSFTQAFETVGTFPYSCTLHSELTGTIVVE